MNFSGRISQVHILKRFHCIVYSCLPPGCEVDWEIRPNTGTQAGVFQTAASLAECVAVCLADPECVAIDVATQTPFFCFTHSNDSLLLNPGYTSPFIEQHFLKQRCPQGRRYLYVTTCSH